MSSHYISPIKRRPSVDGLTRLKAAPPQQSQAAVAAASQTAIPVRRMSFQPPVVKKQRRFWRRLQLPLLILAGILGGLFVQNAAAGAILSVAYCLAALVLRLPSRNIFALATLALVAVCVLLLIKPNGELISNFSTDSFIFLAFGALALARESRLPRSVRRKNLMSSRR